MLPGLAGSYWMDSTDATSFPHLAEDVETEVVVVGGGIAGLCTAWELARAGRSVVLLEGSRIAAGTSGFTTAKVSALHTLTYARLRRSAGPEAARLYARSQQEAVEHAAEVAAELGADCELERVPAFVWAESASGLDRIREEAEAAREAGLEASLVAETGLPFPVAGAVRVEGQAQFHPRRFLLALAADLVRLGGRIFERSRADGLHQNGPCRVTVRGGGTVTASDVVVATHYPVFDRMLLFPRLSPRRELVVAATVPADHDPGGMYINAEQPVRSVRTAPFPDGMRLLIVTGESFAPGSSGVAQRFAQLAGWTRERFDSPQFVYHWAAQDIDTTDGVPFVGRAPGGSGHLWVATGFGGWGMSGGVMAGRLLAALITGEQPPWTGLYDPRRLHLGREAVPLAENQAKVAWHFVGDRLRGRPGSAAEGLPPDCGTVLGIDGRQCAVYRDPDGRLHTLSARCTHLGCLVRYNEAERSWDCPCHGSRYAVDGSVLEGPATAPLARLDTGPAETPDDGPAEPTEPATSAAAAGADG
ncbi:FAD-dependent oxidoreductase [Peterkaempfera bronchialis]|uniref:FAD-dependent oxidoreductase n=1 Tax=Peterkaempfera bronchialis TaxID=2126346 RepID=A0A345T3V1_9ACTN|nr:FAD-dependent oxidoreductase [Peterkaempfera bronchialis]AXI80656.1 FAD-dependent oxidoreductase [Peterkaempfera bronchialis]